MLHDTALVLALLALLGRAQRGFGFAANGHAGRCLPRMIARKPKLAPYSIANRVMDTGPGNPMGARALYLFQDGVDTLYRIHGDALYKERGKAVSSCCIRMLNQDVIHLHKRAIHGASVIVLPSMKPKGLAPVY